MKTATATYTGMNPDGPGALIDHDQLWQSVRDILTTPLGTRVMRREYGSYVPDLLDAPQNNITRLQLMSVAAMALARWEPRIRLAVINVEFSEDGSVSAEIAGTITETMTATSNTIKMRG